LIILKAKKRRLTRIAASTYLRENWGISRTPKSLAKLATTGGGPIFQKDGRLSLYLPENLDLWAEKQLSPPVKSTDELFSLKMKSGGVT